MSVLGDFACREMRDSPTGLWCVRQQGFGVFVCVQMYKRTREHSFCGRMCSNIQADLLFQCAILASEHACWCVYVCVCACVHVCVCVCVCVLLLLLWKMIMFLLLSLLLLVVVVVVVVAAAAAVAVIVVYTQMDSATKVRQLNSGSP